jgi:hypothetical protein
LGNILCGVGVGVAYWLVYLSNDRKPTPRESALP